VIQRQFSLVLAWCALIIITSIGCKDGFHFGSNDKDPVIARVGERNLFKSQLDDLVHDGTSPLDSAAIADGYIQNWVRENLMILEAEKNIAADINLNKLVDDYRSSLLVYNYEKKLVEDQLDTVVLEVEKKSFYENNKSLYRLSHPVFKGIIAKVPIKLKSDIANIKKALSKSDLTEAMFIIREKATYRQLDTAMYISMDDLESLVPGSLIKKIDKTQGKSYNVQEKDSEYFVKVIKYYDETSIAPFDFIEGKIVKTILSERKNTLLLNYRKQIYDVALNNKEFEIYKNE